MGRRRRKKETPSWYWYADWLYISLLCFLLGAMLGFIYGIEVASKLKRRGDTQTNTIITERESDDVLQAEEDQYYPVRSQSSARAVDSSSERAE